MTGSTVSPTSKLILLLATLFIQPAADLGISNLTLFVTRNDSLYMIKYEKGEPTTPIRFGQMSTTEAGPITIDSMEKEALWWNGVNVTVTSLENFEEASIVDAGLASVQGLSRDMIGNLYVADYRKIYVCSQNSRLCSVVVTASGYNYIRGIALHSESGTMFYSESGTNSCIVRSDMDGGNMECILKEFIRPGAIVLDNMEEKVYATDVEKGTIVSANFDGSDSRVIVEGVPGITSIAIFGNRILFSVKRAIMSAGKFDGSELDEFSPFRNSGRDTSIHGLAVFPPPRQLIKVNPCSGAACSHTCVLSPTVGHRCICPSGMSLSKNGNICNWQETITPRLVIGSDKGIRSMRFGSVGKDVFDAVKSYSQVREMGPFVENMINGTIIIFDKRRKRILECSWNQSNCNVILEKGLQSVVALGIDKLSANIFWVDEEKQTLEVMSLWKGRRVVLRKMIENPLDLLLDTKNLCIFISSFDATGGKIEKLSFGGNRIAVIRTGYEWPVSLASFQDTNGRNILSWVDRKTGKLEFWDIYGASKLNFGNFLKLLGPLAAAVIHKNTIYGLVTTGLQEIRHMPLKLWRGSIKFPKVESIPIHAKQKYTRIAAFRGASSDIDDLYKNHDCSWRNVNKKKCSHLCLPTREGDRGECTCPEGLVLDEAGILCRIPPSCFSHQFTCKDGRCISGDYKCDDVPDCEDGEDENGCGPSAAQLASFRRGFFLCANEEEQIPLKNVCNFHDDCIDKSDERWHLCRKKNEICSRNEYKCMVTGVCITEQEVCDGTLQCYFGDDELDYPNCSNRKNGDSKSRGSTENWVVAVVVVVLII